MRRLSVLAVVLAFLPGCKQLICPLVGLFVGSFAGDASGDVEIEVAENANDEDMADVSVRLSTPELSVYGDAVITCDDGMFNAMLVTDDTPDFGDFSGNLNEMDGDGEWSFNTGEVGTWQIVRMD
jgi:hypothetical protein